MSDEMRLVKFEILIRDVTEATIMDAISRVMRMSAGIAGTMFNAMCQIKRCNNPSMLLIYDYDELNDYGKIILEQSSMYLLDWENKYSVESLKESKAKIDAAKALIRYCQMEGKRKEAYKFIFWAMMVLTVDKTHKEEKLSLICDFARMLKISDAEMIDIVQVIKVLYHEENEGFTFQTEIVPRYFSKVLNLYNN